LDGGNRVAEVLKAHGVPFLFTLVGGHISPILVAAKARGIRVIDVRHEVNAVFAADAVARLTGIPGVAAVTAGPGVTNTLTALKNAQLAQSPLVLLGGATATILRGRGALQDIDQMTLIEPHVKYAGRCTKLRDVIPTLERAFHEAMDGVPGPTFVELPVDLLYAESVVRDWYGKQLDKPDKTLAEQAQATYIRGHLAWTFGRSADATIAPPAPVAPPEASAREITKAVNLLKAAERPLVVLGSQATLRPSKISEIVAAIEQIGAPVYLSGMARGLLGADHPLQMRHKRREALKRADVVVLAGVPADFRLDYGAHISRCKVIGLNLSKDDLAKNRRPDVGLLGDPTASLLAIAKKLGESGKKEPWLAELRGRDGERNAEIEKMAGEDLGYVNPLRFCQKLDAQLADDSVLVGDGGDFVATAAYTVRPRGPLSWLDPGVFGTLGVGAGFALGAKLVRPSADVWLLWGDGAAGFSIAEYDTFVRHGVPVIGVIGNDGCWAQIARDQVVILGDDVATNLERSDYHKVAEAFGGAGFVVKAEDGVDQALEGATKAARAGKAALINVMIGRSDFRKGSISI
jgi:acetolactate synthase-like protein